MSANREPGESLELYLDMGDYDNYYNGDEVDPSAPPVSTGPPITPKDVVVICFVLSLWLYSIVLMFR